MNLLAAHLVVTTALKHKKAAKIEWFCICFWKKFSEIKNENFVTFQKLWWKLNASMSFRLKSFLLLNNCTSLKSILKVKPRVSFEVSCKCIVCQVFIKLLSTSSSILKKKFITTSNFMCTPSPIKIPSINRSLGRFLYAPISFLRFLGWKLFVLEQNPQRLRLVVQHPRNLLSLLWFIH